MKTPSRSIETESDSGEIGRRPGIRDPSAKANFSKCLVGIWRDIENNQSWKYDELPSVQLLERLKVDKRLADRDELERAEYFWILRPRFLRAVSWSAWLLVALGLPFWLISAVVANTDIVRFVRWRRQY
jgi:hypothetical protein